MSTHRRPGARPSWLVIRRTRRLARRRLACPEQGPTPAEWQRSALDDERGPVAVQPQGQVEVVEGGDTEAAAALPQGDQHTATDAAETGGNTDQDTAEQADE